MADADAPLPSPPPAWRSVAAALVRSPRARAAAVVTAAIDLTLALVWLLFASLGLRRIGRAACGEGCAVVAAADGISRATAASLVQGPAPNDLIAPEDQPVLCVLMLGLLAFLAFVLLTLVGFLLKAFSPVKGSHMERSGSVIMDVGVLSLVVLNCFIVLPALALFAWKRMFMIWQHI
uniref:Uncharacterized protein n=1 Tax=Setaria italica TaxID=4555 RepID=K3YMR5_SETIT